MVHSRICVELRWDVPNAFSLITPRACAFAISGIPCEYECCGCFTFLAYPLELICCACCELHAVLWCEALCLFVRLTGSRVGDSGAETLASVLPKMASLTTLHLSGTSSLSFELPCVGVSMPRPIRG